MEPVYTRSPMKPRPPTMKDVAEMAGVSKQTVSAVINANPSITGETRDRVQAAIDQLGYRPIACAPGRPALSLRSSQIPPARSPASWPAPPMTTPYAAHCNLVLYNSHDDIDTAAFVWPPLTTVRPPIANMATTGVQLLLDILQGKEVPGRTVIEPRLILRESTAPPPAMAATADPSQDG